MKTTINLRDDVARRLEWLAALRGQTLPKFIEDSLEQLVQDEASGNTVAEWIKTLPVIPKSAAREVEESLASAPFNEVVFE